MTDEERQRLCERLRAGSWGESPTREECDNAANEIERLAAANKELKRTLHHFLRERETDMGTAE